MWALESVDWESLRTETGLATEVPGAIRRLLAAEKDKAARDAYWELEGELFCQSSVFECALPAVRCLMQGLIHCSPAARAYVLELLVMICNGGPGEREQPDLVERCRDLVSRSLPILWSILETDPGPAISYAAELLVTCRAEQGPHHAHSVECFRRVLARDLPEATREQLRRDFFQGKYLPDGDYVMQWPPRPT